MSRKPEDRIADIVLRCEKILEYTSGMDQGQFVGDPLVQDAVLHNIEIIGEATKHLPPPVKQRMPAVEWTKIAGMRDILSHAYFQVDPGVVWDVVESKIPELLRTIREFRGEQQP